MSRPAVLLLHPDDQVGVAVRELKAGEAFATPAGSLTPRQTIPYGHKIALAEVALGGAVRKFGQIIGFATQAIAVGDHVHTHNLECGQYERRAGANSQAWTPPIVDPKRTFDGFARTDGRVGTRNCIAVVGTVNCSAAVVRRIAEIAHAEARAKFPNVDAVFAVAHHTGCGMAASGLDRTYLHRTLGGYANHANVHDRLFVGLGCEVNQPSELISSDVLAGKIPPPKVLSIQTAGGVQSTIDAGVQLVLAMLPQANERRRTPQPISKIVLGTNCGGSDGYSGVTANPALGVVSDLLAAYGGASVLAETTEVYGAEHLLAGRARSPEVAKKLLERIAWWEWYTATFGAKIDNNPSHGNKAGGLTTIFEKSLGAVAKGGASPLMDVVGYAEPVTQPGLTFMDTPGFDPVSVTGIVAGGANVVAFTTGRGSVLGSKPAPTIKIATNSPLYDRMESDMDFDAGVVLAGEAVSDVGKRLFELVVEVASGRRTKSEAQNLGDDEFVPWTVGPVL